MQDYPDQISLPFYSLHAQNLQTSYFALLGKPLFQNGIDGGVGSVGGSAAKSEKQITGASIYELFNAPFALLSHGIEQDPIFNFGNRKALSLFGYSWGEFTALPSRLSAGQMVRQERQQLLERVSQQGYIDNYSGIRIAASGQRFRIMNAVVWNVRDATGQYIGQAAKIDQAEPLS